MRVEGLEPPHLAALDPKSSVSTNSTTLALVSIILPAFTINPIGCGNKIRLEGFEPPAHGFEVRCSIQLSYRRIDPNQSG